jgi:hypothetical protein
MFISDLLLPAELSTLQVGPEVDITCPTWIQACLLLYI